MEYLAYNKARFLHPNLQGSHEQAGFEFANYATKDLRARLWPALKRRLILSDKDKRLAWKFSDAETEAERLKYWRLLKYEKKS